MRIVAVADTHLFHDELSVPPGDVLIHAGDLCREGTLDELEQAAGWLRAQPHRHKLVIAGNHDWSFVHSPEAAREQLGPSITYLQDSGVTIDGVRFWGSPWQPEYNDWAFNLPRGPELAARWALIPPGTHVLITHGPPQGIGDRYTESVRGGCADLRARALALGLRLHLFGHVHQDGGVFPVGETLFANVTTWECERAPTVIDLDPRSGLVTPVTVPTSRRYE